MLDHFFSSMLMMMIAKSRRELQSRKHKHIHRRWQTCCKHRQIYTHLYIYIYTFTRLYACTMYIVAMRELCMQEISIYSVLKCQYQVKGSSSRELKVERLGSKKKKRGKILVNVQILVSYCANTVNNKLVLVKKNYKKRATFAYS